MVKKVLQNYLYQKRNLIKQEVRPLFLEAEQKDHIKFFWKKNKRIFKKIVLFSIFSVLLQLSLPFISNFYIRKYSYFLEINKLIFSLVFLFLLLILFLLFSFWSIKYENTFVIYFLNYLRRKWFSIYLNKKIFTLKNIEKSKMIAKISYHFSLLQMGMSNCLLALIPWSLLSLGLLISSAFISTTLLIIVFISLLFNVLILFLAYVISKYYISQHQTLYSKILVFLGNSLNEFDLIKLNHREDTSLEYLDDLVEIDTFFRIKRSLLMKYGNRIIFSLVIFVGALVYLIEIYNPFLNIENSAQYLFYGIFFSLIIKLTYLSLKIGLFSFPLKLGAVLCIPQENCLFRNKKDLKDGPIKEIVFKSKKFKLSSKYLKNLNYLFKKSERILFYGPEKTGKSFLGMIFSAKVNYNFAKPWVLKVNGERFLYHQWIKKFNINSYLIHPDFQSEESVLSILVGKDLYFISDAERKEVFDLLSKYSILDFLKEKNDSISQNINKFKFSFIDRTLVYMAHALLKPPSILVIDNLYLDLNSDRIKEMISILDKKLKDTIIIIFSRDDNNILNYDQKHNLGN